MENDRQAKIEQGFRITIAATLFVLVLAMYPFTNDPTGDIKRVLLYWASAVLGLAWLIAAWWYRFRVRRPRIFSGVIAAFLILYLISALHSEFRWIGLIETGDFAVLAVLYFLCTQVFRTTRQVQRLLLVLCGAAVLAAVYGFGQKIGLDPFPWQDRASDVYRDIPATYGHPNFAAHTLILTIIMGIYLLTSGLGFLWAIIGLAIMIQHFYLTGQRAGIIALAAAFALVTVAKLFGSRVKSPLKGAVISLLLVAVAGLSCSGLAMVWSKWHGGTPLPLDTSLVIRYQSYISAPNMFFDKPLLGFGPGVYGIAYPKYWTPFEQEWFAQELRMNAHVHNDLLETGIDAGLPAAGLYLAMLVLGMGYGLMLAFSPGPKERRRLGYAFTAMFAAFLVDGLFGFNLRVPVSGAVFFVLMGLLDAIWSGALPDPADARGLPFYRPKGKWLALLGASAVLMVFFLVLGTRVFASQYLLHAGMSAQAKNDLAKAREFYSQGEFMAPWDSVFARRLGQISLTELKLDRAVNEFERSLARNPYYELTQLPLAQAKMLQAQQLMQEDKENAPQAIQILDDASKHLQQLLAVCPVFPKAHDLLGHIASICALYLGGANLPDQGDRINQHWRTAEEHLLFALKYQLENKSDLYRTLAKVRIALGNTTGAEQAYARAMQADPADQETGPLFLEFAQHYKRYDRFRNALYAQIHELNAAETPNKNAIATADLLLANVLEHGYNDLPGTDGAYLAAIENAPLRPEIWSNFARYAYEKERLDALRIGIAQSCGQLQISDQTPLAHVAAVNAVLQQGPAALENASALLLAHVRNYKPMGALTPAQTFTWAAKILLESISQAPAETPGVCSACFNLAITFAALDELDIAAQLFTRAKPCLNKEQQPFLAVHWADLLVRQQRSEEALELLRQAVKEFPNNLDVHWALARTYGKLALIGEAKQEYETLLNMPDLSQQGRAMLEKEMAEL